MDLFTVKSEAEWEELLGELAHETGMAASLTDTEGNILKTSGERYPLCHTIRDNKEALTFICSQTNRAMLARVQQTQRPLVDLCEAGLLRMVVPILRGGELVGQLTACGLVADRDDVEPFLLAKQLDVTEEQATGLLAQTPLGTEGDAQAVAERFVERVRS